MKFWDFSQRPCRPNETHDAWVDAKGRIWHATTRDQLERLPLDPLKEEKIPPEFWHPDDAVKHSAAEHEKKKREQEDRRYGDHLTLV